jgi:3-hydroxybutyrate dehydrogenase
VERHHLAQPVCRLPRDRGQPCHTSGRQSWGRIINTGSAHALVASPYKSAYVAAKHGLAGLTKVVALEVAQDGITVNTICPGYVHTELVDEQIADTAKARNMSEDEVVQKVILEAQPTKQFVTVDQIAQSSRLPVFRCRLPASPGPCCR